MPMVNRGFGCSAARPAKTPATMPGVNSLEDSPYRPPVITGMISRAPAAYASASAPSTSRNSGSPSDPGSLVRSRTATRRTGGGSAASRSAAANGAVGGQRPDPVRADQRLGDESAQVVVGQRLDGVQLV